MKQMRVISLSSRTKMSMLESRALPLCAAAMSQACATCLDSECSSIASSSRDRSLKATTVATIGMNLKAWSMQFSRSLKAIARPDQAAACLLEHCVVWTLTYEFIIITNIYRLHSQYRHAMQGLQ